MNLIEEYKNQYQWRSWDAVYGLLPEMTNKTVLDLGCGVGDQEFSFSGPAKKEVVDAWQRRFDRMVLLHEFCGSNYENVKNEFLSCLIKENHRSLCKVICCIGTC